MYKNKTFLAIIPARAGSKRLPKKNILDLGGKPLIAWSIEAGCKSKYIDEVMVTTDDDDIINISKQFGAVVPFKRPDEYSNDFATRADVIKHTIEFYRDKLNRTFDYLIFLQPTSPLRDEKHIDEAIEFMFTKKADAVVSVCEVEHPIHWNGVLPDNKDMSQFLTDIVVKSRSQDLQIYYRLNGAIYICDTEKFLEEGCVFLKENIFSFLMNKEISIDIDDQFDFKVADCLMKMQR